MLGCPALGNPKKLSSKEACGLRDGSGGWASEGWFRSCSKGMFISFCGQLEGSESRQENGWPWGYARALFIKEGRSQPMAVWGFEEGCVPLFSFYIKQNVV